ncbi:MAG: archaeal proteasome endopeptidase complex subunit alpha [Nitrososphaerales archaeon]|nr:archaeal proteasome endopeptidase complex subunit alpha [Nitrososphaerales archaeon]
MFPAQQGYDRAITVFSPDGRLYQVEYAIETVRRGTLAVGIKSKDGVVMAVEEKSRKLQSGSVSQKIFQIDDHIGVVAAGYIPDARMQVDQARVAAQSNRLVYDEITTVESVARKIADMAQQFTQYAGVRPFGVSLIIAGASKHGSELFLTDPSGTYLPYDAIAIGSGSDQVTEYLEKNYNTDLSLEEACILAAESIYLISEDKSDFDHIKIATVNMSTHQMKRLTAEEIEKIASKAKNRETKDTKTKSE